VLRMRFGIEMNTDHMLEEVAKQFDATRERIRQVEAKALRKLRHPSRSEKSRSFREGASDFDERHWVPAFAGTTEKLSHLPEQVREGLTDLQGLAASLEMQPWMSARVTRYLRDGIDVHNRRAMNLPEIGRVEDVEQLLERHA